MEPRHPDLLPTGEIDREEMTALQRRIASMACFDRPLEPLPTPASGRVVAGIDQAFTDGRAASAVVCMRGGEVLERATAIVDLEIPYIPGLLAFREGPAIVEALGKLDRTPDLLLFDGSGRIHYRQAGLATHVGVAFDVPSVGVIKSLLCGRLREPPPAPWPAGTRVAVLADERVEAPPDTILGDALQTRQYGEDVDRTINPVYVSPGHRANVDTATAVVEAWCDGYKLPEPIRKADRMAGTDATARGRD